METILIIDFGSQYTQLIARRVRELNVYCEIHPCNRPLKEIINRLSGESRLKGIILSGSPFSVHSTNAPFIDLNVFPSSVPALGVCYGAQLLAHLKGGKVAQSHIREYGRAHLNTIRQDTILFHGIHPGTQVWMSHGDTITRLPGGYEVIAGTENAAIAAFQSASGRVFGLQFHPEVVHTAEGIKLLENFVVKICGCRQDWTPESFVNVTIEDLKKKLQHDKVILAISGGVDSTVAAVLLNEAVGKRLFCIFADNGLLRKNEFHEVLNRYKKMHLNVKGVDAKKIFYAGLKGVEDPERKRKIIGRHFIDLFSREAQKIKNVRWLAQGTIYPDVIESVSVKGPSATIKSHHNVGGLPAEMKLKVVEPLRLLFKDEVRRVGKALQISEDILQRHPFPGPGLGIRIIGDITEKKVRLLQEADHIFIENLKRSRLYDQVWQAAAILLPVKTVGVMGDERTYMQAVCLRAVTSTDGMTADWCHLPYPFLAQVSGEIINKVKGINRVVYDISSKPPATIEWE